MSSVVVLPAPLGPSRPTRSPAPSTSVTWSTARRPLNDLTRSRAWTTGRSGGTARRYLAVRAPRKHFFGYGTSDGASPPAGSAAVGPEPPPPAGGAHERRRPGRAGPRPTG